MNYPSRPALSILLIFATGLLGACTRPVAVESTWLEGVPRDQRFSNVLIVGVTPNFNVRCRFERAMAASLRNANVKATASCSVMDMKDPLTKEGVTPVVASHWSIPSKPPLLNRPPRVRSST